MRETVISFKFRRREDKDNAAAQSSLRFAEEGKRDGNTEVTEGRTQRAQR